ncbi:MAG: VCBS repeat-containing protein, partial [Saprospiraceae bacterium]|nr:VCBS repeat-containing protein [Saprospiraceae bacterium]
MLRFRVCFLLLLFALPCQRFFAQQPILQQAALAEICDNGLDDDADGLVDCYDPECPCEPDISCSIASLPAKFTARLAWQSTKDQASTASTPVVGNMNPQVDQMPEIIVTESYSLDGISAYPGNRILFFRGDGSNAANPRVLTIAGTTFAVEPPGPTIGDVDGNGIPELLMTCNDRRIRVYTNYTEAPGAPMTLWMSSADLVDLAGQRPLLADFDGDGISEVYVGSDVFRFNFTNPAAPTLTRALSAAVYLGTNSMGRCNYQNFLRTNCNPTAADLLTPADCNGDPDCNGLELAAGPAIYSIDLDPNDGDGFEIKLQRRLPHTAILQYFDGYTAVADIDLDGVLDVLVASKVNADHGIYVWNKNGLLHFFPYPNNSWLGAALPCVANVYNDKTAGFAQDFPEIMGSDGATMYAFNLNRAQQNPALSYWWNRVNTTNNA